MFKYLGTTVLIKTACNKELTVHGKFLRLFGSKLSPFPFAI